MSSSSTKSLLLVLSLLVAGATGWVAGPRPNVGAATATSTTPLVSAAGGAPSRAVVMVRLGPNQDPAAVEYVKTQALEAQLYNINVGQAIDTLREDIPVMFSKPPDLSIFSDDVRVSDPSGEKLKGKALYSQMYRVVRGLASVALQETSSVSTRLFFDKETSTLRTKINAQLFLFGMGPSAAPVHLDVVSTYTFNAKGLVGHHTIDRLDIDGRSQDPLSFLSADTAQLRRWLARGHLAPAPQWPAVGAPVRAEVPTPSVLGKQVMPWQEQELDVYGNVIPPSMRGKSGGDAPKARKRRDAAAAGGKQGFFDWLKNSAPETCEDDFDCPAALHCCDLVVTRVCCAGGIPLFEEPALGRQAAPAPVYIPVPVDDGFPAPPPSKTPF